MRVQSTGLSVLLFAYAAVASQINERQLNDGYNLLTKRQQFVPTTTTAQGETCADAFGSGYVTCREKTDSKNRLCYNPDIGQTCCDSTWACPSGSFCLIEPNCCPNGSDPKTCAEANGVSIASDFKPGAATGVPGGAKNSTGTATSGAAKPVAATPTPAASYTQGAKSHADRILAGGSLAGMVGAVFGAAVLL